METIKLRGFAAMKAAGRGEEVKAAASKGGRLAHAMHVAHEFTQEEARAAGRKGGLATAARRNAALAAAVAASGDEVTTVANDTIPAPAPEAP